MIFYAFISAFALGVLVIIAPILNSKNAVSFGTKRASLYNYISGIIITFIFLLLAFYSSGTLNFPQNIRPYFFWGGLLGCVNILLFNAFAVKIKAFHLVVFPFMGQITMGIFLDFLMTGDFEIKRILGLLVIVLGLFIQNPKLKSLHKEPNKSYS